MEKSLIDTIIIIHQSDDIHYLQVGKYKGIKKYQKTLCGNITQLNK